MSVSERQAPSHRYEPPRLVTLGKAADLTRGHYHHPPAAPIVFHVHRSS